VREPAPGGGKKAGVKPSYDTASGPAKKGGSAGFGGHRKELKRCGGSFPHHGRRAFRPRVAAGGADDAEEMEQQAGQDQSHVAEADHEEPDDPVQDLALVELAEAGHEEAEHGSSSTPWAGIRWPALGHERPQPSQRPGAERGLAGAGPRAASRGLVR